MTNPDVTYGETSVFHFLVLDGPTTIRPANFDMQGKTLPELTTTDMPTSISTKNDPVPRMYGTAKAGTSVTWAKPRPDQGSWTLSASGNVQPTAEERAAMKELQAARGKYVWVERRHNTETVNEGGCVLITSTGKPVPAEGPVTFSVGGSGYGPYYDDTTATVTAP